MRAFLPAVATAPRALALIALGTLICFATATGSAHAALSWSGPEAIDHHGGQDPSGLACPAVDRCVAVDGSGQAVSFDPGAPGTPAPTTVDPGGSLTGIACPSTSQCSAVDAAGREAALDPSGAASPALRTLGNDQLAAIACPSTSECVAVGAGGRLYTIHPGTSWNGTVLDGGAYLIDVACPSSTQCTAIDLDGNEVTFNPVTQSANAAVALNETVQALACPATDQCTAVGPSGQEVTFDPGSPGSPTPHMVAGGHHLQDVACPSTTSCAAVGSSGIEAGFNPAAPAEATDVLDPGGAILFDVACPATNRCVALDEYDRELTFDPASPGTPTATTLADGTPMRAVSCPSSSQCTAIDTEGRELTFDPASPGGLSHAGIDSGTDGIFFDVGCASTAQCTVLDGEGREVSFEPNEVDSPTLHTIDAGVTIAIACPSTSQCTAVDDTGLEVTFNPLSPGSTTSHSVSGSELTGVSCPTTSQCTAVDVSGREVTFNPGNPGSPTPQLLDAANGLSAVSCPTTAQCTAVDRQGQELTFDPNSPGSPAAHAVAIAGAAQYSVSCPTASFCAIADSYGEAVEGNPVNPGSFSSQTLAGATYVSDISCASSSLCTAVDQIGDAYLGTPAPAGPSPVHFSIVSSTGVPQFAYYIVLPEGQEAPIASDWWAATAVTTPGEATISVAPGDVVYFSRTADVSENGGALVPPEGVSGKAYAVTASTPSSVTVTLPSAGATYKPGLSGAEKWLLGEINRLRGQVGSSPLSVSTTLSEAASVQAHDEAVNHRWPYPYFFAVNQDRGWPGDIFFESYVEADAPFSDPRRVLDHWDGDPSDSESPGIWEALEDPSLHHVGIADGAGAWIVSATESCPDPADEAACGFTTETGDTGAWEPSEIAISAPADGHVYAQGERIASDYDCAAPSPAGVTLASCQGPAADGDPIDTSAPGAHSFTVTATDVEGDTTSRTVHYEVQEAAPRNVSAPGISGEPVVGARVTGTPGTWSPTPDHYVMVWLRCPEAASRDHCEAMQSDDVAVNGSDAYAVQAADYGDYLVLEVKGVSAGGAYEEAFSPAVRVQAAPPAIDPHHLPSVAGPGRPKVGDVLTASSGQWSGTQPMLISYGWLRCPDTTIDHCVAAATSSDDRYTLQPADVGDRMLLVVTAHNASGQSAKAFASHFTGVVDDKAGTIAKDAGAAAKIGGKVGSVSGGALLDGGELEIALAWPGIVDLLSGNKLISDKGLGLTEAEVAQLISEVEGDHLISDKGLGLVHDKLISDKGLGLIGQAGGNISAVGGGAARASSVDTLSATISKGTHKQQPLFVGAHKFRHRGKAKIKLRLSKAGRRRIAAYERAARKARAHHRKVKPLHVSLVTIVGPTSEHGVAVFAVRQIVVKP